MMVEGKESQAVPSIENGSLSLAAERVEEGRWVQGGRRAWVVGKTLTGGNEL